MDFKKLGIKLGGGAAIGAAFMLLASYLTIPTRNSIVVPLPSGLPSDFKITNLSPEDLSDLGEVRTVGGRQFIYVEFRTDHDSGNFKLDYLDQSTPRITNRSFRVTMEGEITEVTATR